jgi:hypothetical protein
MAARNKSAAHCPKSGHNNPARSRAPFVVFPSLLRGSIRLLSVLRDHASCTFRRVRTSVGTLILDPICVYTADHNRLRRAGEGNTHMKRRLAS